MKIVPKLVDHDILKPKKLIQPIVQNHKPFLTWNIITNLIGICILILFGCFLYERYIFHDNYKERNVKNIENTLSYINEKLK
jgi:hypothetical protein